MERPRPARIRVKTASCVGVGCLPKPSNKIKDTSAHPDDSRDTISSQKKRKTPYKPPKEMTKDCKKTVMDLEKFRQELIAELVNTQDKGTKMVEVDDIILKQKDLQCLTQEGETPEDKWLQDDVIDAAIEILRRNNPRDIRNGQMVFIERAVNVGILARDGRVDQIHDEVLAGKHGTTKGDNYLQHDMVHLPTNMADIHWFLLVVNPRRREIQILDSLLRNKERSQIHHILRGMEAHLSAALRINGALNSTWPDINVTRWPKKLYDVPRQSDGSSCGLFMLKNIQFWTGEKLSSDYDQDYIENFRKELPVDLLTTPYNSCKTMKRMKRYHQELSESAKEESAKAEDEVEGCARQEDEVEGCARQEEDSSS